MFINFSKSEEVHRLTYCTIIKYSIVATSCRNCYLKRKKSKNIIDVKNIARFWTILKYFTKI